VERLTAIGKREPGSVFRVGPLLGMLAFLGGWLAGLVGVPLTAGTLVLHGIVAAFVGALVLIVLLRALSHRRLVHT
jgi:uncharacterized membrane protein YeaQ/YmgE (transglycosylase-associated protein family)